MRDEPVHVVLGFFSTEDGDAEKAAQALRSHRGVRSWHFAGSNLTAPPRGLAGYSGLRLDGESLVAAQAPAAKVHAIVKELRANGSPAVFVLREDGETTCRDPRPARAKPNQTGESTRPCLPRLRE